MKDVKEKAVALSEYPENKFRSVLTTLFGKMPALLSDNLSSSSDSSYVSTVTDLTADPVPVSEPAVAHITAAHVSAMQVSAPVLNNSHTGKQMKKKSHRKRKKGSAAATSPTDKVILPPPPPPVLETPSITSASYADMLRKPQPLILSECSSETDLSPPMSNSSISTHSTSCPDIAWDKCPPSQCKHTQLEFLNESSISSSDNQLANVISISQAGDLQSVFESSKSERSNYQNQSPTTLRPYSIYNHQSDTMSDSHQKLINYFSREWRKVQNSNKDIRAR